MRKFFEDLHSGIILLKESLDPVKCMSTLLLISVSPELLPVSSIEQRIWGLGDFFFNNKNGILAASSAQRQSHQQVKRKSELFSKWKNYTQKRRGCFTTFRDVLELS